MSLFAPNGEKISLDDVPLYWKDHGPIWIEGFEKFAAEENPSAIYDQFLDYATAQHSTVQQLTDEISTYGNDDFNEDDLGTFHRLRSLLADWSVLINEALAYANDDTFRMDRTRLTNAYSARYSAAAEAAKAARTRDEIISAVRISYGFPADLIAEIIPTPDRHEDQKSFKALLIKVVDAGRQPELINAYLTELGLCEELRLAPAPSLDRLEF